MFSWNAALSPERGDLNSTKHRVAKGIFRAARESQDIPKACAGGRERAGGARARGAQGRGLWSGGPVVARSRGLRGGPQSTLPFPHWMTRPLPGQPNLSCPSSAIFGGPGAGSPAASEELRPERGARRLGTDAWPAARQHSARLPGPAPARTRGPPARPVPSSAVFQRAVRRRRVLQNKRLPYPSRAVAKARASLSRASAATMATSSARPAFLVMTALALLLLLCVGPGKGASPRR